MNAVAMPTEETRASEVSEVEGELVAARAYELFLAGEPGGELDHWLRAEQELQAEIDPDNAE